MYYHYNPIRKLAQSSKWQTLFSTCKEIPSLKFFNNLEELSDIQIIFLNWVQLYKGLLSDISYGENYISEEILKDEIRTDAYLIYRQRNIKKQKEDIKNPSKKEKRGKHPKIPSVVFTKRRKK